MSERPKELASKASVVQATEGSNPSVTARDVEEHSNKPELADRGSRLIWFRRPARGWAGGPRRNYVRAQILKGNMRKPDKVRELVRASKKLRASHPASLMLLRMPSDRSSDSLTGRSE